MVDIKKSRLGALLIQPKCFEDHRGEYLQIYNEIEYREFLSDIIGTDFMFVEDDISLATKHVLKGVHGDNLTWKLVSCLYGKIYLVIADPVTCEWESFTLSDVNRLQILIPPNFGNGHLCMSEKSIYHYKQTELYDLSRQFTIVWNDPKFNIWWPVKTPILSRRDEKGNKEYVEK